MAAEPGIAPTELAATLLERIHTRIPALGVGRVLRSLWGAAYLLLNATAFALDRLDERHTSGPTTLRMNLLVTARRPAD
jgi:hypothetical protein